MQLLREGASPKIVAHLCRRSRKFGEQASHTYPQPGDSLEEFACGTTLPKMKGGFCVSIVGGRGLGSTAVVAGCAYGRRSARPRIGIVIADDADGADGADGIFGPTDPNHPGPSSALTTEGNVDAHYPQECLRTTQSASEGPRVLRPSCGPARKAGSLPVCTSTQKVRSASRPRRAARHELPHPSGHRIRVD